MTDELDGGVLLAQAHRSADDWQDAIHKACAPLIEAGAIDPGYADRCVAMVVEHGPYIVLAPGIALAHARPEDGVRQLAIAVVTLEEAITFGHPENDPVDVVFAFGSPDADQHVGLLSSLAGHLLAGMAERLREAQDDTEAQRVLEEIRHEP